MKFVIAILFLLCWSFSEAVFAQSAQLELDAGAEFGWWSHQLGAPELGIARTHHSVAPFVSLH